MYGARASSSPGQGRTISIVRSFSTLTVADARQNRLALPSRANAFRTRSSRALSAGLSGFASRLRLSRTSSPSVGSRVIPQSSRHLMGGRWAIHATSLRMMGTWGDVDRATAAQGQGIDSDGSERRDTLAATPVLQHAAEIIQMLADVVTSGTVKTALAALRRGIPDAEHRIGEDGAARDRTKLSASHGTTPLNARLPTTSHVGP